MPDTRTKVAEAIKQLSQEGNKPGSFFIKYSSAQKVAERAQVSVGTARRYANELSRCRGYAMKRFAYGDIGYLYHGES